MFSATIPETIEKLASRMMVNPIYISVGLSGAPSPSIKQIVLWVEDKSKKKKLFSIIDDRKHFLAPALVFVDSKIGADMLSDAINEVCYLLHTGIRYNCYLLKPPLFTALWVLPTICSSCLPYVCFHLAPIASSSSLCYRLGKRTAMVNELRNTMICF